jgi:hypothetical protein
VQEKQGPSTSKRRLGSSRRKAGPSISAAVSQAEDLQGVTRRDREADKGAPQAANPLRVVSAPPGASSQVDREEASWTLLEPPEMN